MQAHFWARTGNWRFSDWRHLDFSRLRADPDAAGTALPGGVAADDPDDAMTALSVEALKLAMTQEGVLPVDAIPRVMAAFHRRMDPTRPAKACGSCGVMDVPMDDDVGRAEAARIGVTRFFDVHLGSPLLAPLAYSPDEAAAYDAAVPPHIEDTPENRAYWMRYKLVKSSLLLAEGLQAQAPDALPSDSLPVRMHLYPALCTGVYGLGSASPSFFFCFFSSVVCRSICMLDTFCRYIVERSTDASECLHLNFIPRSLRPVMMALVFLPFLSLSCLCWSEVCL